MLRLLYICPLIVLFILAFCPTAFPASAIGPFELANKDSTASLQVQFAAQLRADLYTSDGAEDKLTMEARRIRLSLSGFLASPELTYKTQLSFAPNSNELLDIYVNYAYCYCMQFRFGQFKVPFTEYRLGSFQNLTLADWSIATRYFGAERQMGFAVHNGYRNVYGRGYTFGVFTGVNARASHAVGIPVIYGEKISNPSDLSEKTSKMKFHPELIGKLSYRYKPEGGKFDAGGALSAAWDIDPTDYQDFSIRLAPEILVTYNRFTVNGLGYFGFVDMHDPSITKLGVTGYLLELKGRVTDKIDLSARYTKIDIEDFLSADARTRAQDIIDRASSDYQLYPSPYTETLLAEISKQYANAGDLKNIQEFTAGVSYMLIRHHLKWQNDFVLNREENISDVSEDEIHIRSQFQLVF